MPHPVRRHATALALATACLAAPAAAQADRAALATRLDAIASTPVTQQRAVGLVAAVVRGNDTLLFRGYGKADVEWNVPMPTDAVFEIGSIAKQFTAVAILQLRDAGKLALDDEVTNGRPGESGPATEIGFNPAKGLFFLRKRQ